MRHANLTTALAPLFPAILLVAACTHYQGPRGPAAEALFELYNGDWILDADASVPAPESVSPPLNLSGLVVTGGGSGPTLRPQPCPRGQICVDRPKSSGDKEPDPTPVPDSALQHTHGKLATHQASRLTLLFTSSFIRVSQTGLGTPLEVPMDSRKMEIEHELGDFPVKAWSGWKNGLPSLTISVGDDKSWVSDTYELPGDGTLVVTRELGGGFDFGMWPNPRFVYRRADTPSP